VVVLVAVGLAVAVFGALVLLRFPDRPGGKIAWQGFEVSSVGAGLPLIALAVGLPAFATVRGDGGEGESPPPAEASSPTTTTSTSGTAADGGDCTAAFLADIPAERKETLATGANDRDVISGTEELRGPIGLRLTERGTPVGAVRVEFDPDGPTFYVDKVVDASCTELTPEAWKSSAGDVDGDEMTWNQYEVVCLDLGPQTYVLETGGDVRVRFDFRRSGCEAT
jgi:hypothetical protein